MTVFGFGIFGMWGPVTDIGEEQFSARVAKELSVDIGQSPYRDYDVNTIVAQIEQLPNDATVLVWGTSLGANNGPVVGAYTKRTVHGLWGFQASLYGAQVQITPNVLFAHEVWNPNLLETGGLGAYKWQKRAGNATTGLVVTPVYDLHPGDGDVAVQDTFLAEMRRVIATAQAGQK